MFIIDLSDHKVIIPQMRTDVNSQFREGLERPSDRGELKNLPEKIFKFTERKD
jgi:hypothetical protein